MCSAFIFSTIRCLRSSNLIFIMLFLWIYLYFSIKQMVVYQKIWKALSLFMHLNITIMYFPRMENRERTIFTILFWTLINRVLENYRCITSSRFGWTFDLHPRIYCWKIVPHPKPTWIWSSLVRVIRFPWSKKPCLCHRPLDIHFFTPSKLQNSICFRLLLSTRAVPVNCPPFPLGSSDKRDCFGDLERVQSIHLPSILSDRAIVRVCQTKVLIRTVGVFMFMRERRFRGICRLVCTGWIRYPSSCSSIVSEFGCIWIRSGYTMKDFHFRRYRLG